MLRLWSLVSGGACPRRLGPVLGGTLLAAFSLLALAQAGEQKAGGKGKQVQITWHGQSFFEIRSTRGTNVVLDPHLIPEYGRVLGLRADLVLITHPHTDHNAVEALANKDSKSLRIITGWKGEPPRTTWNVVHETFKDFKVRSIPLYHDNVEGMKYGKNTAFALEVDGWKIVHLGDLGHLLSPAQVKLIGKVDVLLIPVGGVYTINGSEARQVVEQIKPKEYILPMHCGTKVYDDLLSPAEFLEDQPKERVAISKDNRLVLNRDPQRPRPLIVQLNYWPQKKRE